MLIILIYGWINYICNLGKLPDSKQQREMKKGKMWPDQLQVCSFTAAFQVMENF